MITRTLALAAASTFVLSASASASAAKPGPFSGASINKKIYVYGDVDPRTDKGKVTFTGGSSAVTKFKLKQQGFMCGTSPAEIPVSVATIKLNSKGKGKGTYTDPNVGAFKIKITARNGKSSGTITPTGLCSGKVTFSAKRK